MQVASLEHSKELYELSGWGRMDNASSTDYYYDARHVQLKLNEPDVVEDFKPRDYTFNNWSSFRESARLHYALDHGYSIPAYDLGYLLRKLHHVRVETAQEGYNAHFIDKDSNFTSKFANTPEDAVAKLAIELLKQEVLK